MKRLIGAVTVLAFALVGCGHPVDFKDGMPTKDTTNVNAPSNAHTLKFVNEGQALQIQNSGQALQGDVSGLYLVTLGATVVVNGTTLIVLGALSSIVENPPTSVNGDTAVWGPSNDPLSPIVWKLTATRQGLNVFNYELQGKGKGQPDTAYVTALSGTHTVSLDAQGNAMRGFGHGSFVVTWGQNSSGSGDAQFTYSRENSTATASLDVIFQSGGVNNAKYHYEQIPGGDGKFQFAAQHAPATGTGSTQNWSIESRWMFDGSGRSDVTARGGDLTAPATVNECWDANFRSQYLADSNNPTGGWGSVSSCAFATAEYSAL